MKTSFYNQKKLPLVIEPDEGCGLTSSRESLTYLSLHHRDFLRAKILEHGALLLRGFPPLNALEITQFVRLFSGRQPLDYVGGASPRIKLWPGVYTSTEYSQHLTLPLHNELSYTYRWPEHLFFCCLAAPQQGGETILGDSRALLKSIDGEAVRALKRKKIRYDRNLCGDPNSTYSWQAAFETSDKSLVEDFCIEGGIDFKWKEDGGLRLSEVRPATALHPLTDEEVWFNQADGFHPSALDQAERESLISGMREENFRLNSYYGDNTPIDPEVLAQIREGIRKEMVLVRWEAGDILIIDNMLAAHGRMPFTGARKILLAMA